MFFRPLEPLREKVLVELEAVLVHRVNVAQPRNDEVDDRASRRDNPGKMCKVAAAATAAETAVAAAVAAAVTSVTAAATIVGAQRQ